MHMNDVAILSFFHFHVGLMLLKYLQAFTMIYILSVLWFTYCLLHSSVTSNPKFIWQNHGWKVQCNLYLVTLLVSATTKLRLQCTFQPGGYEWRCNPFFFPFPCCANVTQVFINCLLHSSDTSNPKFITPRLKKSWLKNTVQSGFSDTFGLRKNCN